MSSFFLKTFNSESGLIVAPKSHCVQDARCASYQHIVLGNSGNIMGLLWEFIWDHVLRDDGLCRDCIGTTMKTSYWHYY